MIKRLVELRIVTFIAVLITVVLLVGVAIGALFLIRMTRGLTWVMCAKGCVMTSDYAALVDISPYSFSDLLVVHISL